MVLLVFVWKTVLVVLVLSESLDIFVTNCSVFCQYWDTVSIGFVLNRRYSAKPVGDF